MQDSDEITEAMVQWLLINVTPDMNISTEGEVQNGAGVYLSVRTVARLLAGKIEPKTGGMHAFIPEINDEKSQNSLHNSQ